MSRNGGEMYPVKTISLNILSKIHCAPAKIDYLSIDTEGSEFKMLNIFNFKSYAISVTTYEYNFPHNEKRLMKFFLLTVLFARLNVFRVGMIGLSILVIFQMNRFVCLSSGVYD